MFIKGIEHFAKHYQHTIQAMAVLISLIGIPIAWFVSWWKMKKRSLEILEMNLVSISVINVSSDAIAEIKNTSAVDGSDLLVRVYKPIDFESVNKNPDFLKYVANSKQDYTKKKKILSNYSNISWNPEPILNAQMSIGESVKFHLKDINEEKYFVHFAPVKIEISERSDRVNRTKYILFRYASVGVRSLGFDNFITNELHPYNKWTLIFSENK